MADEYDAATLEGVAFVGEALSPFFLQDPRTGSAGASFAAMAGLNVREAAKAWPFADLDEVERCLALMANSLRGSLGEDGVFVADDDLMWENRRLFIGPGAKPAPPLGIGLHRPRMRRLRRHYPGAARVDA